MESSQIIATFNSAATEYIAHRNGALEPLLQKSLAAICVVSENSIFDASTCATTEFFVNLHELMNVLGPRSHLIWDAIDVLQFACKNSNTRQFLIQTYRFTPILTRLLETNLTSEKRIRVLKLLQELTYGIKILWLEPHLVYLLKTLSEWVTQSSEEEEITLSLGVLVNLCYKNLPAVYSLMRTINTKSFLQAVVKTKGQNINIRVQCCKLLIILECTNCDIPENYILDVATVTFSNIIPALENQDTLLLRHIVDFFNDIRQDERFRNILVTYPGYTRDVDNIINVLESVKKEECMNLVFEFLLSLIKLKMVALVPYYISFLKVAMSWIANKNTCSKALCLIRFILIESKRSKNHVDVMEELDLSEILKVIEEGNKSLDNGHKVSKVCKYKNYSELMQLFQEFVKVPAVKTKLLKVFSVDNMKALLEEFGDIQQWDKLGDKAIQTIQETSNDFYIHALALTSDLAANATTWLTLYTELSQKKHFQMIMALKLFTGDNEVKQKVLQLTSKSNECISAIAKCLSDLEPLILAQGRNDIPSSGVNSIINSHLNEAIPLITVSQEERLDDLIYQLSEAKKNNFSNGLTSSIVELYEYKLATMKNAQKATEASLEAASNYSNSLQHRLAEVTAQSSQMQKILLNTQQCLEGIQLEKTALMKRLIDTEEQTKKSHHSKVLEINGLKKVVLEKESQIVKYNENLQELKIKLEEIPILLSKIKDTEEEYKKLQAKHQEVTEKNAELHKAVSKMQEIINKKEQIIEEKNKEIASNQKDIAALNQDMQMQVQQCHNHQKMIAEKEEIIERKANELKELSRMRDMIFELTARKKDDSI